MGKAYFWGEVCGSEPLVLAEYIVALSASPDVDRSDDLALLDQVHHSEVDYVVLVCLQRGGAYPFGRVGFRKAFGRMLADFESVRNGTVWLSINDPSENSC